MNSRYEETSVDLLAPVGPGQDTVELRRLYDHFPSGVVVVCGLLNGEPLGLAASSFVTVSVDPPLVAVCAQVASATWPLLHQVSRLGVSILQESQADAWQALSDEQADRFAGVAWSADSTGAVFLSGAVAWLRCSVEDEYPAGDHRIVLLRIKACRSFEAPPLVLQGSRFWSLHAGSDGPAFSGG